MEASALSAPAQARRAPPVLAATALRRDYGAVVAVDGIDLVLEAGDFLTIFGPNGAGKTSLLSLLGGRLRPSGGEIRVSGEALDFRETGWRARIGILSHQGFLYPHLTIAENLRFFGRLFGLRDLRARIPARLEAVGLADRAGMLVRNLSHGMRQRAALARTLLHDPELVLLDEPYTGLDPYASGVLRDVLSSLQDGRRTVVMVTHNLAQGLELSTRLAIQVRGRLAWEGLRSDVDPEGFEHFYHGVVERWRV